MKSPPIPKPDQIEAMNNGTIFDLLGQYVQDPRGTDFRKLISVDRADLVEYLAEHRSVADDYFLNQLANSATHDVEKILRHGSNYVVVSLYHGDERCPRYFDRLPDAVAECVLVNHGMY